jgi:intergrase/recombinase
VDGEPVFSLKYLRKWQYNFLIYNKDPESVADFIHGRSNKSIGANHYLAKSQQAGFWYWKVVGKLERLFGKNLITLLKNEKKIKNR